MLRDGEITRLQAETIRAMPDNGLIYAVTRASDGRGGTTESEAAPAATMCRLDVLARGGMGALAQSIAAKIQNREIFTLELPAETSIQEGDYFEVNDYRYQVIQVLDGGSWEIVRRVIVVRTGEAT